MKRRIFGILPLVFAACLFGAEAQAGTTPIFQSTSKTYQQAQGTGGLTCAQRCERGFKRCLKEAGGNFGRSSSMFRRKCFKKRRNCRRKKCGITQ